MTFTIAQNYWILFADDENLFFKHKDLKLESEINSELANAYIWLSPNTLSLNIEKSNLIFFFIQYKNDFPKRLYYL